MSAWVYMMASDRNGTIYIGVTTDLSRCVFEHQLGLTPGFTSKYGVRRLVWMEQHESIAAAIHREKRLKKYPRKWKMNLIESVNPDWEDVTHWLV